MTSAPPDAPRAAPATASTLSSDIDTSATTICQAACTKVLGACWPSAALIEGLILLRPGRGAQFAPHLPTRPDEENAAGKHQADDRQEFDCDERKSDARFHRRQNADRISAPALLARQPCRGDADDYGIVAGEHQVNQNDLR